MALLDTIAQEAVSVFAHGEFAETASYTRTGKNARSLPGIFDRVSEVTDIGELVEADGVAATFLVATSDVPDVARGDRVVVRGYDYAIVGIEPDGTGHTTLVLSI